MRLLIVEDDEDLCRAVSYQLTREGYTVDTCFNGGDAMHYIRQNAYHLILLDRMLPEQDGISILMQMRSAGFQTPVILITAMDGIGDRIEGLDSGADDYIVKPFDTNELLARIRAVSRRPFDLSVKNLLEFADLSLDRVSLELSGPSSSCTLSRREAELLAALMEGSEKVIPRTVLLSRVWGPDAPVEDGNLDNYIHFLRRRLAAVGSCTKIRTVRSVGYCLKEEKASC